MGTAPHPPSRPPAPGDLALVQSFVNTLDIEAEQEQLTDAEALRRWLLEHGLIADRDLVAEADLRDAIELRESLRAVLLAHNGIELGRESARGFERVAARVPLAARLGDDGDVRLAPALPGAAGAWGKLLAIAAGAARDGTWQRLKACPSETCHWAFYDHSKNRSGQWCTMRLCGTRSKMRRYRENVRRRAAG